MNFPEMIFNLTTFMFSDTWKYLGMIFLIITIRGDITKALKAIGGFFKAVKDNYKRITMKPADLKGTNQKIGK